MLGVLGGLWGAEVLEGLWGQGCWGVLEGSWGARGCQPLLVPAWTWSR